MKITVLLPVFNAERTLPKAVESILKQHYAEFEFLIIDDGSTDGSKKIIDQYAKLDRRIRPVYHQENKGLAFTLNEGLEEAKGEYVARMDADDQALPHRLSTQLRFLSTRPSVTVAGGFVFFMGRKKEYDKLIRFPMTHDNIVAYLERGENCISHPTVMMNRKKILEMGGYRREFRNSEDYDLWLRVSRSAEISNIPVALIRYRFSVSGMTLGRKWEQLYYVALALISHQNPSAPFEKLETMAREKLLSIDKVDFLSHVALYTAAELRGLGYPWEALRLLWKFSLEIGMKKAVMTGIHLLRKHDLP